VQHWSDIFVTGVGKLALSSSTDLTFSAGFCKRIVKEDDVKTVSGSTIVS